MTNLRRTPNHAVRDDIDLAIGRYSTEENIAANPTRASGLLAEGIAFLDDTFRKEESRDEQQILNGPIETVLQNHQVRIPTAFDWH